MCVTVFAFFTYLLTCEGWLGRAAGAAPRGARGRGAQGRRMATVGCWCKHGEGGPVWFCAHGGEGGDGRVVDCWCAERRGLAARNGCGSTSQGRHLQVRGEAEFGCHAGSGGGENTGAGGGCAGAAGDGGAAEAHSSTQIRREGVGEYEDPRSGVRGHWGSQGAGRTCARARRAETVAERLRREGARVHEDTRFEVGAARPLADLRHVLGECPGECPGRGGWRGW